jgi:hypothetical protein
VADPRFADAIGDFLTQETAAMDEYLDELAEHIPSKNSKGNPYGVTILLFLWENVAKTA